MENCHLGIIEYREKRMSFYFFFRMKQGKKKMILILNLNFFLPKKIFISLLSLCFYFMLLLVFTKNMMNIEEKESNKAFLLSRKKKNIHSSTHLHHRFCHIELSKDFSYFLLISPPFIFSFH
jgi:hypothetical protein